MFALSTHSFRRFALALVVCLAGALLAVAPVQAQGSSGVLFGVSSPPTGNETQVTAIENLEADLGTTLPLVRVFDRWDSKIDNTYNNFIVDGGRQIMISIKPQTEAGQVITWNQVANAAPGSAHHDQMVRLAREINALDGEVWLAFHHEPEAGDFSRWGDSDDFQAAWRNFHSVLEAQGVDAQWVWTMTGWSFSVQTSDQRSAGKWYPGNDVVDVVGADIYNWNSCRNPNEGWRDMKGPLDPVIEFADARGKLAGLPEFGVHAAGAAKAEWLRETRDLFKQPYYAERLALVSYFDSPGAVDTCDWPLQTSAQSFAVASEIANDPFFRGSGAPIVAGPALGDAICDGQVATIVGTPGDDVINGTSGPDVIAGLQGNDTINGLGGDDIICGGRGNDVLSGGQGFDVLFGAQDNDTLYAVDANGRVDSAGSRMFAGAGNDTAFGSDRWDRIQGGDGADRIFGYEGRDWIRAGSGGDDVVGGGSIDDVNSGAGNDRIVITAGDKVRAGTGFDTCTNRAVAASAWSCER